jgi:hypothetical protein
MKQTAVDWIVSKLSITFQTMYSEEIEQAKEMEKEQIIDAHSDGQYPFYNLEHSEQYYNQTYKENDN